MRADFHMHSVYSDGSDPSETLFKLAKNANIDIISITDHDTLNGVDEHCENAKRFGVKYITGVELSAYDYSRKKACHIIGLGVNRGTSELDELMHKTLSQRHAISLKRVHKLIELGYRISFEDFTDKRLELGLYKQDIMEILISRGYAMGIYGDFYQQNFKNGGPLDYQIDYPSYRDAIKAITAAGGIPILAHPTLYNNIDAIEDMVSAGLLGIECHYPSATEDDKSLVLTIAETFNLMVSGGSDYHGKYADKSGGKIGEYFVESFI